jgi:hypothetical protein
MRELTVGDLLAALKDIDPDLPIKIAIDQHQGIAATIELDYLAADEPHILIANRP